jgi:hypothetical protein
VKVTIHVPRIPAGAISNLVGMLGLVAMVVAVGGLAGVWWAVLTGGVFAVGLAVVAQLGEQSAVSAAPGVAAAAVRPTVVPDERSA